MCLQNASVVYIYNSAMVPCACICLTFQRWQSHRDKKNTPEWSLYSQRNIHPRWDPKQHPLYHLAATRQSRVCALGKMSNIIYSGEHPEVGVDEAFTFDTTDEIGAASQFSYVGRRIASATMRQKKYSSHLLQWQIKVNHNINT